MEQVDGSFEFIDLIVPLHPGLVGRMLAGRVDWVTGFGLFVGLEFGGAGIDGLLRFDQTPYPEVARRYRVGDVIYVVVTAVDCERGKISLALPAEPTVDGWQWFPSESGTAEPAAAPNAGGPRVSAPGGGQPGGPGG